MIYAATREIEDAFQSNDWDYEIEEREYSSSIFIDFDLKSGGNVQIEFYSAEDNDVDARVYHFMPIPTGKWDDAIRTCNDINKRFPFVKFVAESDGDVGIVMYISGETVNIGDVAVESAVPSDPHRRQGLFHLSGGFQLNPLSLKGPNFPAWWEVHKAEWEDKA